MPLADSEARPLRTAVVRLKSYGKGEDVHVCKNKRPHLLVLTPDALQLFTSADAGPASGGTDAFAAVRATKAAASHAAPKKIGSILKLGGRSLHPAQQQKQEQNQQQEAAPARQQQPTAANSAADADSDDELEEGQVFRVGVALSQVHSVQIVRGNRILITYQPNRPSKRGLQILDAVEEQTYNVLRGLMGSLEALHPGKSGQRPLDTAAVAEAPRLDRHSHHFTIVAADEAEAAQLKGDVERAQRRLVEAVEWLGEGLPLRAGAEVVMVTVTPADGAGGGSRGGRKGRDRGRSPSPGASSDSLAMRAAAESGGGAGGLVQAGLAHMIAFPQWCTPLELPAAASTALALPASREALDMKIRVYLTTPLGQATAEVPVVAVQRSAAEGSCPVTTVATLRAPPPHSDEAPPFPAKRWQVLLHWHAKKGDPLPASEGLADADGGTSSVGPGQEPAGGNGSGSPRRRRPLAMHQSPQVLAGLAAVLLAVLLVVAVLGGASVGGSWWSRCASSLVPAVQGGSASATALVGVAAVSGVAALLKALRRTLAALRAPVQAAPPLTLHRWHLVLLDAELEEETEKAAPASPPMKRTLSSRLSRSVTLEAAAPGAAQLPLHIKLLVQQHPEVLTPDIARRFVVGLGSETKAFTALTDMVNWTVANNLAHILRRQQPAYAAMKRHYPHAFAGWSRKKDCLVEIECMGQWPAAYTAILQEGVSEQQMLEHLLFTYQYAFSRLDPRPLPHGKTVKIVDLEGLCISDLKTPGFRLITRVGAMLSLNFPQRLQRCFLVNAPTWWAVAWRLISPLVPAKVRAQMSLYGKKDEQEAAAAMLEWVDADVLPAKYGGENVLPRETWAYEIEMAAYVETLNGGDTPALP